MDKSIRVYRSFDEMKADSAVLRVPSIYQTRDCGITEHTTNRKS
jgi:hypothetical protein